MYVAGNVIVVGSKFEVVGNNDSSATFVVVVGSMLWFVSSDSC